MRGQRLAVIRATPTPISPTINDAFDYVVCHGRCRRHAQPRVVLEHMLRIGRHGIVSFQLRPLENACRSCRRARTAHGQSALCVVGFAQHHFCTIKDFRELCLVTGAKMENRWRSMLGAGARPTRRGGRGTCSRRKQGVFLLPLAGSKPQPR